MISLYAITNNEDLEEYEFNLKCCDSLFSDWKKVFNIESFDYIIGNPPYINNHDLKDEYIENLKRTFETTKEGVFNIFYAFIEKSAYTLSDTGKIGYIIPNNFLHIKSAERLRQFIKNNKLLNTIIDFKDNTVFSHVLTYNSIIFLNKNNSLFKFSVLILPVILASVFLIFIGNGKNFNFQNIFPILGNGIESTFFSGLSNIYAFYGIAYLFFIPNKLKHPEKIQKITLISIIISALFLLTSSANILLLFGRKFSNTEFFPLYVSVLSIEFGAFFERLDSMFMLLCILVFVPVLSLNAYVVLDIFKNITNISNSKPLIFAYLLAIFGVMMCYKLNSTILFLETTLSKILFIALGIILHFVILILANVKKRIIGGNK